MKVRYVKLFLLLAIINLCTASAWAQLDLLAIRRITRKEGLTNNYIQAIAQDSTGYIWVGTNDGLNRLDGNEVKTYFNQNSDTCSLIDNKVSALTVDTHGNLWIGSQANGICRYDAANDNFRRYKTKIYSSYALSHYFVSDIKVDAKGRLWVATQEGLNLYHEDLDAFEQFNFGLRYAIGDSLAFKLQEQGANAELVHTISGLKNKVYTTRAEFLNVIEQQLKRKLAVKERLMLFHYVNEEMPYDKKIENQIQLIQPDEQGNLWLAYASEGFAYFDTKTGEITKFAIPKSILDENQTGSIKSIVLGTDQLYLGTFNSGVFRYIFRDKTFVKAFSQEQEGALSMHKFDKYILFFSASKLYLFPQVHTNSPENNLLQKDIPNFFYNVTNIFKDKANNYWVASEGGGLLMLYPYKKFYHWQNVATSPISLSNQIVSALHADKQGHIFVGYYRAGMDMIDLKTKHISTFGKKEAANRRIEDGSVLCINSIHENKLWLGSYYSGLQSLNIKTGEHNQFEKNGIIDFRSLAFDQRANIWAASHGNGLYKFSPQGELLKQWNANYANWQTNLPENWLRSVCVDKDQQVWVSSTQGITRTDTLGIRFKSYRNIPNDTLSLSHSDVLTIFCDSQNNIWLGTPNGLNLFNRQTETFQHFSTAHGLGSNSINSIAEDASGNLWLGTNTGISRLVVSRFDGVTIQQINNYDIYDGVPGEFSPNTVTQDASGTIYFGGKNGVTWFSPNDIKDNPIPARVVITDIKILNQSIFDAATTDTTLRHNFIRHKSLTLDYDQKVIGIQFSALNFTENPQNEYRCMLEGFDEHEQNIGNQHQVNYTNLAPGEYTLRIRASNNDGIWAEQTTNLHIRILPPFWMSALGRFILVFASIGILLFSFLTYRARQKQNTRLELRRVENQKTEELNESKSRFFTNITHEFRTPITLIISPIRSLLNLPENTFTPEYVKPQLELVHRNADLLLRLVNQILDQNKDEAGKLEFRPTYGNIIPFITNIADTFKHLATEKDIKYTIENNTPELFMLFEPNKLEKIIYNLLSNAFKYTLKKGEVVLHIQYTAEVKNEENTLKITVRDTGIGISEANLQNIFTLYYQADNASTSNDSGTGIGLYMVQTYAQLHGGQVTAQSQLNLGSTFTVSLPVKTKKAEVNTHPTQKSVGISNPTPPDHTITKGTIKLLLVEDNADMRHYLNNELSNTFEVHTAENGHHALNKIQHIKPDFILTDVMMPQMDGYEFCKTVKNDINTCHIPVIMLTAKIAQEDKIKGYAAGADDYLTKPFDTQILILKIQRLLEIRRNIQSQVSQGTSQIPEELQQQKSAESQFLEKMLRTIETNLANTDLNVVFLSEKMGVSRSVMYEKVNILTGQPVADFIKTYRLNRAAELIKQNEIRISEVAWKVGFKSHAHFTRAFKQKFGSSPTEYIKNEL